MELSKDLKEYTDMFYEPVLTENQFVSLFLSYLYKRGIRTINEQELTKKLYPYYQNEKYRLLFSDISKDRYDTLSDKVNIYEGIEIEKWWSGGNIMWTSNNPNELHLHYGNYDPSYYEEKINNPEIIKLLNSIADDFGVRNKIEDFNLNVYGYNPNQNYTILTANEGVYEEEIITDGKIKKISNWKFEPHLSYNDPFGGYRRYEDAIIKNITIKKASYAIIQGFYKNELKKIEIMTKIVELEKLKEIRKIANQIHDDKSSLLVRKKPYIKRFVLNNK